LPPTPFTPNDYRLPAPATAYRPIDAFYREVETALGEDPSSQRARQLARRWDALLDAEAAGDPRVKASLLKAWHSRAQWPPLTRQWAAGCYMMSEQRWLEVGAFLERAAAA
jgi:hypothetical protein